MLSILVISFILSRISWVISERNVGVPWNGYGCVENILNKSADAPMAYRVLMPLLLWKIPHPYRLISYFVFHWLLTFAMLMTCKVFFGLQVALFLSFLVITTVRYDYWDWIVELGGVIACVSGNIYVAIVWSTLAALSRETAIVLPVIWITSGHSYWTALILSFVVLMAQYLVRRWQGPKKKYCETIMLDRNGKELKEWLKLKLSPIYLAADAWQNPLLKESKYHVFFDDMTITIMITIASLFAVAHFGLPFGIPIILFLGAGWTFAIARENRVFSPILFWLAIWLSSAL